MLSYARGFPPRGDRKRNSSSSSSFLRPSETGDRTTPVSDQRDCPPPPLALTAQDSVPQLATHSGGHCARRGCVAFLLPLEGMFTLDAHGLLRFRTDDVLLGTSGVGVCVSVVSNSLGIFIMFLCYIGHHACDLLPHEPISVRWPLDDRVAPDSKPAWS